MKTLLILLLTMVACHGETDSFQSLSKLLKTEKIVKVDCYVKGESLYRRDMPGLNQYFTDQGGFLSIEDEQSLEEVNVIFEQKHFERKKDYAAVSMIQYTLYVFVFTDTSELYLMNSATYGKDQFVICEASRTDGKMEIKDLELTVRSGEKSQAVAVNLPGFSNSASIKQIFERLKSTR